MFMKTSIREKDQSKDFLPVLLVTGDGEDCLGRFLNEGLLRVCSTLLENEIILHILI